MGEQNESESRLRVLLVEPSQEDLEHIRQQEACREWIPAPPDGLDAKAPSVDTDSLDAVVVFSKQYEEKHTSELCRRIREWDAFEGVPILVAITPYEMPLGNEVKEMPLGQFVFKPVTAESVEGRLEDLQSNGGQV